MTCTDARTKAEALAASRAAFLGIVDPAMTNFGGLSIASNALLMVFVGEAETNTTRARGWTNQAAKTSDRRVLGARCVCFHRIG